jgi:hypothetical protein
MPDTVQGLLVVGIRVSPIVAPVCSDARIHTNTRARQHSNISRFDKLGDALDCFRVGSAWRGSRSVEESIRQSRDR